MAPLKVIHVITRLDQGGSAQNTLLTALRHDRARYAPMVAAGEPGRWTAQGGQAATLDNCRRLDEAGIPWTLMDCLVRHPSPWQDLRAVWRLWRLFRAERPDIVHTHTSKAGTIGRVAAWLARVQTVIHTPHGHVFYGHFGPVLSWIFLQIERLLAPLTSQLIALTDAERDDHLVRRVGTAEQWSVIPSGIDLSQFQDAQRRGRQRPAFFECPADAIVIGSVGWLTEIKGHRTLIEAMAQLVPSNPRLHLVLVGTGHLHDDYVALAAKLGIERHVHLVGHREDIPACLAGMDIFVLPSLNEGMGRALVEAMAASLPVIASRVGGVPGILEDHHTGLLVPPADPSALASAIAAQLRQPARARAMALAASQRIGSQFDVAWMVPAIEAVYARRAIPTSREKVAA